MLAKSSEPSCRPKRLAIYSFSLREYLQLLRSFAPGRGFRHAFYNMEAQQLRYGMSI